MEEYNDICMDPDRIFLPERWEPHYQDLKDLVQKLSNRKTLCNNFLDKNFLEFKLLPNGKQYSSIKDIEFLLNSYKRLMLAPLYLKQKLEGIRLKTIIHKTISLKTGDKENGAGSAAPWKDNILNDQRIKPLVIAPVTRHHEVRFDFPGLLKTDNNGGNLDKNVDDLQNIISTHEMKNIAADIFLEIMLAFNGGIDLSVLPKSVKSPLLRKLTRIHYFENIFAVEKGYSGKVKFIIAKGADSQEERRKKITAAIKTTLHNKGVRAAAKISEWVEDLKDFINADFRDDAVLVNERLKCGEWVKIIGKENFSEENRWDFLKRFAGEKGAFCEWIKDLVEAHEKGVTELENTPEKNDFASLSTSEAILWMSRRFGGGTGVDFNKLTTIYLAIGYFVQKAYVDNSAPKTLEECLTHLSSLKELKELSISINSIQELLDNISHPGPKNNLQQNLEKLLNQKNALSGEVNCLGSTMNENTDEKSFKELMSDLGVSLSIFTNDAAKIKPEDLSFNKLKISPLALFLFTYAAHYKNQIGDKGGKEYANNLIKKIMKRCGLPSQSPIENFKLSRLAFQFFTQALELAARRFIAHRVELERRLKERLFQNKEFESKMSLISSESRECLDKITDELKFYYGKIEQYVIRLNAIQGWDKVVMMFSELKGENQTEEARLKCVEEYFQQEGRSKKNDLVLFSKLALDSSIPVWRKSDDPNAPVDSEILFNYSKAHLAEEKVRKYKIPAICHINYNTSPVYNEYGVSRWRASLECDINPEPLDKMDITFIIYNKKTSTFEEITIPSNSKRFIENVISKAKNPNISSTTEQKQTTSNNETAEEELTTDSKYKQKINGRLRFEHENTRIHLEEIKKVQSDTQLNDEEKQSKITSILKKVQIYLDIATKVIPAGNAIDYIRKHLDFFTSVGKYEQNKNCCIKFGKTGSFYLNDFPDKCGIVSVDFGINNAAFIAEHFLVKPETLLSICNNENVKILLSDGSEISGRNFKPSSNIENFMLLIESGDSKKKNKKKQIRLPLHRINPDTDTNGREYSLVWSIIVNQFPIRLPGEKTEDVREILPEELQAISKLEHKLGLKTDVLQSLVFLERIGNTDEQNKKLEQIGINLHVISDWKQLNDPEILYKYLLSRDVDKLYLRTVQILRAAIARRNYLARFAYHLVKNEQIRGDNFKRTISIEEQKKILSADLSKWYYQAHSEVWDNSYLLETWNDFICTIPGYIEPTTQPAENVAEEKDKITKSNAKIFDKLATFLLCFNSLREEIYNAFEERVTELDQILAESIQKVTKLLRGNCCLQPNNRTHKNLGGLNYNRINAHKSLYRAMTSFHHRLFCDGTKNTEGKYPGSEEISKIVANLTEERIRTTVKKIIDFSTGKIIREREYILDELSELINTTPHIAIVVEDLENFKQNGLKTKAQNNIIRAFSPRKLSARMRDGCTINGQLLIKVNPAYTSQVDSRTGAPGVRVEQVPISELIDNPYRQKQFSSAKERINSNREQPGDQLLLAVYDCVQSASEKDSKSPETVMIPKAGGSIFLSADEKSPIYNGINADLNAAVGIGRAAVTNRYMYRNGDRLFAAPQSGKIICNRGLCESLRTTNLPLEENETKKSLTIPKDRYNKENLSNKKAYTVFWPNFFIDPKDECFKYLPTGEYFADAKRRVCDHLSLILASKFANNGIRGSPVL
ncbi:MAG: type V CRISPR-associated protein Cas12b [Lactobacillales bacterium]|jgi:IS605 OrfB family transposase|nr:type V CRISPR-associated protein Cas12b [Lactobacillales bacterium]